MTDSVSVDQQSAGIERLIVNNNIDSSVSGRCTLSLHDERSLPERATPEGRHLNSGDGVEDSEEMGYRMPQRVAVRFADGSAMDEHVNVLAKYFQTVSLSGGCKIKSHRLSHDKKILFITYVKDMKKIFDSNLSETTFSFDGMTLTLFKVTNDAVEPMVDGPEEDDKFLVTLLPPGVKEEDLKLFVEQNSSNTISSMELQTGRAMLTLRKPFDFPGLAQAVHAIPLRGYMLAIQKVPLSLAILVSSNNGEELYEEDLRITLSYEAQRCTGNIVDRLIQEIAIDKQTKKKAIVKFFDRQVVNEMLAKCEAVGTLTLYHECMTEEQRSSTTGSKVTSFPVYRGDF